MGETTVPGSRRRRRARVARAAGFVATLVLALATLSVFSLSGQAAPGDDLENSIVGANVFGAEANLDVPVGVDVATGELGRVQIGCVNDTDHVIREVAGVHVLVPGSGEVLVESGTMVGEITVTRAPDVVDVVATETIESASMLDGLVQLTGIQARAHSRLTAGGVENVFDGSTGTTILSLVVDGVELGPIEPAPNTEIPIPLVGTLVLNEQIPHADGITVNAVHLYIDSFAGGTGDVILASATTHLTQAAGQVGAEAFAARVVSKVAPPLVGIDSGKLVHKGLECDGGRGSLTAVGIDQSPAVTSATATSTVAGRVGRNSAFAEAQHTIEAVSVLDGLITADAIEATARTEIDAGGNATNSGGATFVNLVVAGTSMEVTVPPNTRIALPGVGFVILNQQQPMVDGSFASMSVTAIKVVVNTNNTFGLPIGTEIIVAHASTRVRF